MTLPVVDPPDVGADAQAARSGDARVAGVLLAAGTSSRYGDANKLLAAVDSGAGTGPDESNGSTPRDGDPMVRRSARTLLDAGLDPVVVVVGHEQGRVRDALAGLGVTFAENPEYGTGQASSVHAGVSALRDAGVDAAVFALGDMPYVDPATVRALVAAHEDDSGAALAAGFEGERGNPVLFGERHFDALAGGRTGPDAVDGDAGGKQVLLSADDAAVVETDDPGVRRDIDEPGDFA